MNPTRTATVTLFACVLLLAAGCGADSPGEPKASSSVAATSDSAPEQHDVVQFADAEGEGGIVLEDEADVAKLVRVPEEFKAFIAAELKVQQSAADPTMTDCHPKDQYIIAVVDPAGHAAGDVAFAACGGAQLYWAKVDGQWRKVLEGQNFPACDDFKRYKFPVEVAGDKCLKGTKVVAYVP